MLRSFLNKDPTFRLYWARPQLGMLIAYSDNTLGGLADFFCLKYTQCTWWTNWQKYVSEYIKISKIVPMHQSFFLLALPAKDFSIRILQFG
jgi:hypothetical protein